MVHILTLAYSTAVASIVLNVVQITNLGYDLANSRQFDENDAGMQQSKDIISIPILFAVILIIEVVRALSTICLIYGIETRKYLIVYFWILIQTACLVFLFVVMPMLCIWHSYINRKKNVIGSWVSYPIHITTIYIQMLFYVYIQEPF